MSVGNLVRLGLRFAWPRHYVARVRAAAVALIALLITLTVLVLVSAATIVDHQQSVEDARAPLEPNIIGTKQLLLVGTFVNEWDGHTVTRVVIARGKQLPTVHPPGVPVAPEPGEAYVSPAVARDLAADGGHETLLGQSLSDFRVAGVIKRSGLVNPHEYRIVQGVDESTTRRSVMTQTERFGTSAPAVADFTGPLSKRSPISGAPFRGPP